ncbi:sodium-independent anion transporter, partial [Acinetobacter baumannii]
EHIQNQITEMIANFQGILKLVILDMSASSYVDVSGSKMLLQLSESLKSKNIQFKIVEALSSVRDILREQGMEEISGKISRQVSIE